MEASQRVFCRIEKKYRLSEAQYHVLREQLNACMVPDAISHYTLCNLYFDTPDYRLIRASIEKPVYKEKLRVRSYGTAEAGDTVYVEIKKKFHGVVYKRRIPMSCAHAADCLIHGTASEQEDQIGREISWFLSFYHPVPKVFLTYEREALTDPDDPGFRLTFDSEIRCRTDNLTLSSGTGGELLLEPGERIMEVKAVGGMPLWMSRLLDEQHLYPTSFSKYGTYYTTRLLPRILKGATASA